PSAHAGRHDRRRQRWQQRVAAAGHAERLERDARPYHREAKQQWSTRADASLGAEMGLALLDRARVAFAAHARLRAPAVRALGAREVAAADARGHGLALGMQRA